MGYQCDCSGWATRANIKCSDGRTILKDAFKHHDGEEVPVVWSHRHDSVNDVLGKALLEHRAEGVYAYINFNSTEQGQNAKLLVQHGDINALSICANKLKQQNGMVSHGIIREVSLVLAGANPGAYIENVMKHGEESDEEAIIFTGETIALHHAEELKEEDMEVKENVEVVEHAEQETSGGETVKEVFESAMNKLNEKEQTAVYAVVGSALEAKADDDEEEVEHSEDFEGGEESMKHNVFDQEEMQRGNTISHADQEAILSLAKQSNVGSFKQALDIYMEENGLAHSDDNVGVFEDYGVLFPEFELLKKGEPETLYKYDNGWVGPALAKIHKQPFSRIRTRHADARIAELKAKGYKKKGDQKTVMNQITMINRQTTPQTIYIKDSLHRDDIIDVTDFDVVAYQWKMMRHVLNETMILSAMVGDGRELDDPDKISEEHIRPIWKDNEEYTIHCDVDIEKARKELQGTETGQHFGDNYVYAEAIITAALYAREKFKGSGSPDFYCTPHLVNVMLLARDLNGRRIYDSKADLAKALNCNAIIEVEHFEGLTRETEDGDKKKLLGLFVNLNDYVFGSTKGGEITSFADFDIDFNLHKYLLETRLSGSLYKLKSAIALEEPVNEAAAG